MREQIESICILLQDAYDRCQDGKLQRGRDMAYAETTAYERALQELTGINRRVFQKALENGEALLPGIEDGE